MYELCMQGRGPQEIASKPKNGVQPAKIHRRLPIRHDLPPCYELFI